MLACKSETPATDKWVRATKWQVHSTKYHRKKNKPHLLAGFGGSGGIRTHGAPKEHN